MTDVVYEPTAAWMATLAGDRSHRYQQYAMTFDFGMVEPGESKLIERTPTGAFHVERIAARHQAWAPELRRFMTRVGGSKKRGRRASWMWSAEMLMHRSYNANISLDSIVVKGMRANDAREHLLGRVSLDVFSGDGGLRADAISPADPARGGDIALRITNLERYRTVNCVMMLFGTVFDRVQQDPSANP